MKKNFKETVKDNAPTIFSVLSGISFGAAQYFTFKYTPKALEAIEEHKKELGVDKLSIKDTVKATWRCFIPTALADAAGVTFLTMSIKKNAEKSAAFSAAVSVAQNAARNIKEVYDQKQEENKEYREAVESVIPAKKKEEINEAVDKARLASHPYDGSLVLTDGDQLCFDSLSGRYFASTITKIDKAINQINHDLNTTPFDHMFISVNEYYSALDNPQLTNTESGDILGWYSDRGLVKPTYSSRIREDGAPCIVVSFNESENELDFLLSGNDSEYYRY